MTYCFAGLSMRILYAFVSNWTSITSNYETLNLGSWEGHRFKVMFLNWTHFKAVFTFGVQKQADFLCDPFSALRRLRTLKKFLNLMDRVLTPKLHAKSVRVDQDWDAVRPRAQWGAKRKRRQNGEGKKCIE